MSFVLRIVFSGMMAFGWNDANNEAGAILVRGDHTLEHHSKDSLVHRPYFEFDCDEVISPIGVPCHTAFESLSTSDSDGVTRSGTHRFSLRHGYDIWIKTGQSITRGKLNRVEPNKECKIDGYTALLSPLEKIVQMKNVAPKAVQMRKDIFDSKLSDHAKKEVIGRFFMTEGCLGTVKQATDRQWKFKTTFFQTVHKQEAASLAGLEIPIQGEYVEIVFVSHVDGKKFSLRFKPDIYGGDGNLVEIGLSNSPSPCEYCSHSRKEILQHFEGYYNLSEQREDLPFKPYPSGSVERVEACRICKRPEDSSGKYPIICLKPEMQGTSLPNYPE